MLLMRSIKLPAQLKVVTLLLVALQIQSCATQNKVSSTDQKTLDHISKDITDMVDIEQPAPKPSESPTQSSVDIPHKNLYLESHEAIELLPQNRANFATALQLMKVKKWHKAQQLLDKVIASQPELSGSYVNKALIAIAQQDNTLALQLLNTAINKNPNNPYAHNLKGMLARSQGKFSIAEQSYKKALEIWPQYSQARLNMAILLELYRGKLLTAKTYYQQYLEQNPEDERVKRWLAGLEIKLKRAGITADTSALEHKANSIEQ